ncbi:hypothetical protein J416_08287 [Gracilibacillus halophilus YIM-C55.5]|uniref:Uncharacterized protein n=1 Tax=Gracilibacillus halophilus YIM-C55.5 TaxID=1308866 RepID=N4WUV7_9BACI|nr:hypothetical protein [Gracilibacillus halophilus]ENH96896.1 hypothetical protein J416_08287 [Gracilibacillus halophilus YIM-C55.5]
MKWFERNIKVGHYFYIILILVIIICFTGNLGSITAGDINGVNINGSTFTQDSTDGTITLDNNGFELLDNTYDEKIFIGITNSGGNHGGNYGVYFQRPDDSFLGGLSYYYTDLILEGKSNVSIIG